MRNIYNKKVKKMLQKSGKLYDTDWYSAGMYKEKGPESFLTLRTLLFIGALITLCILNEILQIRI